MKNFNSHIQEITQAKADALRSIKNISKTNPKNRLKAIEKARETIARADKNATRHTGVHGRGEMPHTSKHLTRLPSDVKNKLTLLQKKRDRLQSTIASIKNGEKKVSVKQQQNMISNLVKVNAQLGQYRASRK